MSVVNSFILASVISTTAASAMLAGTVYATDTTTDGTKCTVEAVGEENTANEADSKFVIKGSKVTAKFKVTGENCDQPVTLAVWESPNAEARPLSAQRLFASSSDTFEAGVHTLTAELPLDGEGKVPTCFYQVDLVKGPNADADDTTNGAEHYGNERLLGFVLGGTQECAKTPETPKTPEAPKTPETPKAPETPTTPAAEEPEELLSTGPAGLIGSFAGITTAAGAAHYFVTRRRG